MDEIVNIPKQSTQSNEMFPKNKSSQTPFLGSNKRRNPAVDTLNCTQRNDFIKANLRKFSYPYNSFLKNSGRAKAAL